MPIGPPSNPIEACNKVARIAPAISIKSTLSSPKRRQNGAKAERFGQQRRNKGRRGPPSPPERVGDKQRVA